MSRKVYIDLDGTLIDVKTRYFQVFKSYIDSLGLDSNIINIDLYYENRERGYFDLDLVKSIYGIEPDVAQYKRVRNEWLESEKYLKYDSVIAEPDIYLKKLEKVGFEIILLSVRNNKSGAMRQLSELHIAELFKEKVFLSSGQENVKLKYLQENADCNDIVIGDGKLEIEAAKELKLVSYYVKSGLGTEKEEQKATYSFDNYRDAILAIIGE